jgi:hypothetical protein
MWKFFLTAAVVLVSARAGGAQPGRACEYSSSVCESYAAADAVFVGTVTRIVPETIRMEQTASDYDQTAYVEVEKVYKGARRARIVLRQLGRRHAQKFIKHSRYLFYANYDRRAKIWEVRPCGNTRHAEYVQDDLRYLDALPASAARTRVSGAVARFDPDDVESVSRLPGVTVRLFGGGRAYETKTGADGLYEFSGLPPGHYRVEVRPPNGLAFYGAMHTGYDPLARAKELEFDLAEGGCAGLTVLFKTDPTVEPGDGSGVGALRRPAAPATFRPPTPY